MNTKPLLRRMQQGLSLVELMVALAIGTFLLAGAITVFAKTRDLYRTNDDAARLQETARYAMSTIEADLRMANYWGLVSRADLIENGPMIDLANSQAIDPSYSLPAELTGFAGTINLCGNFWAVKLPVYVEATDSYTMTCGAFGAGAVAGSDTLTIRRASTQVISAAALAGTSGQIKLQTSLRSLLTFKARPRPLPIESASGGWSCLSTHRWSEARRSSRAWR